MLTIRLEEILTRIPRLTSACSATCSSTGTSTSTPP